MASIPVTIVRFADEAFPGWVECILTDAQGQHHTFIEKVPVVALENLGPLSAYPQGGSISCEIVAESEDSNGRKIARITTERPWGIESITGSANFNVLASQLSR